MKQTESKWLARSSKGPRFDPGGHSFLPDFAWRAGLAAGAPFSFLFWAFGHGAFVVQQVIRRSTRFNFFFAEKRMARWFGRLTLVFFFF
jgi:hypothetical protein